MDWSRRLEDPAVEGELKRVLDRRAAGGLPHGLSPARCGRALEPRDRSDPAGHLARDQVARAPGAAVSAEVLGGLRRRQPRWSKTPRLIGWVTSCGICLSQSCGKKLLVHPAGRSPHPNQETEEAMAAARSRGGMRDFRRLPLVEKGCP